MADRVRMKAKTVFNNPLITTHREDGDIRSDPHTVIEDDEFSTGEVHASELERLGFAERIEGEAAEASERAIMIAGAQTPSTTPAIALDRTTTTRAGKADKAS